MKTIFKHLLHFIIIGLIMSHPIPASASDLISHHQIQTTLEQERARLSAAQNLTLPVAEELKMLEDVVEFELGRFLLENKGLNSFLTPPPMMSPESSWKNFVLADVIKQKALFADVLQTGWQCFRT